MSNVTQALVVGPSWVGDMVMAQVLFELLKVQDKNRAIHVMAPAWTLPLLDRMPQVDKAIVSPFAHKELRLKDRMNMGRSMRGEYQEAYLCPNSFKSAIVPYFADIPKRVGFKGEFRYGLLNDIRHLDKDLMPLMIQRFAALAYAKDEPLPTRLPKPKLKINEQNLQRLLNAIQLDLNRPILSICPGAEFGPSKRWPSAYYAKVVEHHLNQGYQVLIFGSHKDDVVASEILDAINDTKDIINLCGQTSLGDAVDLLSISSVVLTNDSGLMHIAAALSVPQVAVYGSSSPGFTPPLNEKAQIVKTDLPCRPCFKRECPLGHHHCMKNLEPSVIINALNQVDSNDL